MNLRENSSWNTWKKILDCAYEMRQNSSWNTWKKSWTVHMKWDSQNFSSCTERTFHTWIIAVQHQQMSMQLTQQAVPNVLLPHFTYISIYYVHKVDVQRRDSTFAPSRQLLSGRGMCTRGQTSCGLDAMSQRAVKWANVGVCQSAAAAVVVVGVFVCSGTAPQ